MEFLDQAWGFLGPAGTVLVVLACVSLYLSLHNGIYLHMVGKDFYKKFSDIERNDGEHLKDFYHASDNPLIGIIGEVVMVHAAHSQDIRAEVAYMFHRNFAKVSKGLAYLRLISVVSPLLGLMGTMLGMVEVFQVVASSPSVDSTLFAEGIWEALVTTIFGLTVAIPTLFCHYSLTLKIRSFKIEAVEHSYRAIELFNTSCPFGKALSEAKPHPCMSR